MPLKSHIYTIVIISSLFGICCASDISAQQFIAGEIYFDSTQFVVYRAGNLPIILSAPHGGGLRPDSIPDRACDNCVTSRDSWTQTITEGVYEAIVAETGCYPHAVINLLHRIKFDANRNVDEAALGIPIVEQAWRGYHQLIDSAKARVELEYSRGLFLDMHGHAHAIQRIELGYLLNKSVLQLSDEELDTEIVINESSIRTLEGDNLNDFSHSDLLRGAQSLGTLLTIKGLPSVPSLQDPFPLNKENYFSGGFNTVRHGSRDNGGRIDAIQIEMNQEIRFDEDKRAMLIDSLATVILDYISIHYHDSFQDNFCNILTDVSDTGLESVPFSIYPNPTNSLLQIRTTAQDFDIHIVNQVGQVVNTTRNNTVDVSHLPAGYYLVQLSKDGLLLSVKKLIVF